jgi:hypothetical protein
VYTFDDLRAWLDKLPDQVDGKYSTASQTNELYVQFYEAGLVRPGDEAIVESFVARSMQQRLESYLSKKIGTIYWRTRLETEIVDDPQFLRADENGPDIDFSTNTHCVKDHNWKVARCYCRVLRSAKPAMLMSQDD